MKAWMKEKKLKSCNQCHTKLAPKYELKADGVEQFKKLGGKLLTPTQGVRVDQGAREEVTPRRRPARPGGRATGQVRTSTSPCSSRPS